MDKKAFSLILSTINRTSELDFFFDSLLKQTFPDFECIIVDQNQDDRAKKIVEKYQDKLKIVYCKSEPGLSKARNIGLHYVNSYYVAFPDDDCWYPPSVLSDVYERFINHPDWDGITGIANTGTDNPSKWKWIIKDGLIDRQSVWNKALSITIFLKTEAAKSINGYDTNLGLGSTKGFHSGEETDFLIRLIDKNMKIYFQSNIVVHHDDHISEYSKEAIKKGRGYARGNGRVLRKNRYPLYFVIWQIAHPFLVSAKSLFLLDFNKTHYFINVFIGKIEGWLSKT